MSPLVYHKDAYFSSESKNFYKFPGKKIFLFFSKKPLLFQKRYVMINKLFDLQMAKKRVPGVAKFGIALEWGSRGLEFESQHSDHRKQSFHRK